MDVVREPKLALGYATARPQHVYWFYRLIADSPTRGRTHDQRVLAVPPRLPACTTADRSTCGCYGPRPAGSTGVCRPVPPAGSPVISGSSPLPAPTRRKARVVPGNVVMPATPDKQARTLLKGR